MSKKAVADPPAKGGRPRVDEPGTSVSTWLRPGDHDKLIRLASLREMSVSALVRDLLRLKLR